MQMKYSREEWYAFLVDEVTPQQKAQMTAYLEQSPPAEAEAFHEVEAVIAQASEIFLQSRLPDAAIPAPKEAHQRFLQQLSSADKAPTTSIWQQYAAWFRILIPATLVACALWVLPYMTNNQGSLGPGAPSLVSTNPSHTYPPTHPVRKPATLAAKHLGAPIFHALAAQPQLDGMSQKGYTAARPVQDNAQLAPGDLLQLTYQLPQSMHIMVVSLNQQGEVFAYVPLKGRKSIRLQAGTGTFPRKRAFVMDGTLGSERFFAIYSMKPFTYQQVKATLLATKKQKKGSPNAWHTLPGPWVGMWSFVIQKRKRLSAKQPQ